MPIKYDKRNYRKHNDRNKELINKSLKECGAGRSIVIDNEGEIIAGNGIYEQAQKLGIKTKIIETDGSELVVVKRTDLSTDDEKRKRLAVMDNSTSDSSEFDLELLSADFDSEELTDFGIDISGLDSEVDMPELDSDAKKPFQQITFTLSDEQAERLDKALTIAKNTADYGYMRDNSGNENGNGNALATIIEQWLKDNG